MLEAKKIIPLILFLFLLGSTVSAQSLRVLNGPGGGTNIGSTTAGDIGNCLKVSSVSPLVWTIGACGSSGGGGTDGNWVYFNGSGIRLATTSNQVLIGASATTTNSALEVKGAVYANNFVATATDATSSLNGTTDLRGDVYIRSVSANTFLRLNSVDKVIGSSYIDLASGDVGGILPVGAGGTGRDAGTMGGTTGAYASADKGLFYWNETLQFFENNSALAFDASLGAGTLLLQAPPRINDLSGGSACSVAGGFALGTDNDGDVECVTLPVSGGSGVGTISTSTQEVSGQIPFFTTTNGYPAQLGSSEYIRWNGSDTLLLGSSTDGNGIIGISYSGIASQYGNFPALSFGASSTYFGFDGSNLPYVSLSANDTGDSSAGNAIIGPGAGEVAIVSSTSERVATFASSTSGTSSFSGGLFALNSLFGGNQYKVASCDLKADATTGAFYCGTDASGSGGGLASSSPWTKGQLTAVASDGALYGVSSSTLTFSGPFRGYSALGNLVGGTNSTLTWTGLATTTNLTGGQILMSNGGAGVSSVATGTVSSGTGISVTAGQSIIGSGLTITNTGVTSLSGAYPLSFSGSTGAITASFNGLATSSTWTAGRLAMVLNGNTVTSIATTTVTCAGTVSCTSFVIPGSTPITLTGSGGSGSPKTYSYIVDADGLGDFTTIQGAMDACGAAGSGSILLTDQYYYQGGTGLLWKGSRCSVRGMYGSTTIEFAGATAGFKTNSPAGLYNKNALYDIIIVGDGTAGSVAIDASDMTKNIYQGITIDNVDRGVIFDDTQDITFENTLDTFSMTTISGIGIDASSTKPANKNTVRNGFIGSNTAGFIGILLDNLQGWNIDNVRIEPGTNSGTVGVKVSVSGLAANNGTFAVAMSNMWIEGAKIGYAASTSLGSKLATTQSITNSFISGNTTDMLEDDNSNTDVRSSIISYSTTNRMSTTTFSGGTFFTGLSTCSGTSFLQYSATTGRFSCGTPSASGGLPGNIYADSGRLGIGSSTPWGSFSVVGTSTSNPILAAATSTTGFAFFWAQNPNSSSTIPYNGAAVSQIGINLALNGTTTLRDNTYIGGRTVNVDYLLECDTFGNLNVNITADANDICGNWSLDADTDLTLTAGGVGDSLFYNGIGYPNSYITQATPVTGDTGAVRGSLYYSATNTAVMSTLISLDTATSSSFRTLIGFISTPWGADYGTTNTNEGAYFEASSTANNNWYAVVKVNGVPQMYKNTGVATSTSLASGGAQTAAPQRMRIEVTPSAVNFFINNDLVARHTGSIPARFLAPIISMATVTTQTPSRRLKIVDAYAWMGKKMPTTP